MPSWAGQPGSRREHSRLYVGLYVVTIMTDSPVSVGVPGLGASRCQLTVTYALAASLADGKGAHA
jgi:hypothetical protein